MPVSVTNSRLIYDALKACDVKIISALPETWLVVSTVAQICRQR
jgi:sulfopyruvate decarboxylase subunit alpha